MKQNNYFQRILSAVLLLMVSTLSWAYDFEAKNEDGVTIYYNLINDGTEAEVASDIWYSGDIVIPSTVSYDDKTFSVTRIGDDAFAWRNRLTSVTIPESVTSIGYNAFAFCSSLASVTIPESVTTIGVYAFAACSELTSIIIPEGVTSIAGAAFSGCSSLTSVTIPEGVTRIDYDAFSGCSSLTSVTIPESVTSIENYAFAWCSSLTSVYIPKGVTSMGHHVFSACPSLESITVSVDNPIYDSREGCNAIIAGYQLITGCKNTIIPESVMGIGYAAFSGCSSLTSINIPDRVIFIANYAFDGCSSLTSIDIPNSVTNIYEGAFYDCSSLTSINIPNSVTSIESSVFRNCSSLTSIDIPNSVISIASDAFSGCSNLTCIISHIEEPFIINESVWDEDIYSSAVLYCPNPELYRETDGWKNFTDIRPITREEEVTLAIDDEHYATFIAPFDVEIPANVAAYTVSSIKEDGETLQMDELTGTIPANTPVVLYSNDIVNETVTGIRTTQETTYTHGLLTGVYTEREAPIGSYVLQNQYDKVAFYYVEGWWSQPTIKANQAYLTVPEANGVNAFYFGNDDDETTGIQATVSERANKAVIYDLTGRRVEKAVKGMYVIDGKKVMVK